MPLQLVEKNSGKTLELEISGKLEASDFPPLERTFDRLVHQHGKIRVLVLMLDFQGWDGVALWDEVKFDVTRLRNVERLAAVGDKQWEKFLSVFARPFTSAKTRYFDKREIHQAREWLESNAAEARPSERPA